MSSSAAAAAQWTNRTEIRSESSGRLYVVAQRVSGPNAGTSGCSCPMFKSHRQIDAAGRTSCKHLRSMGLKGPLEHRGEPLLPGRTGFDAFQESAYAHYDTRQGFGSPDEWFRAAERLGAGRGGYRGPRATRITPDMVLLGLLSMPADVSGLKSAMRAMAFKVHPDYGGSEAAFSAMFAAYERLLRSY